MSILFEETQLHGMILRNRFVRSATWECMATEEGRCTKELVDLTVALAKGGLGLIVMGHAYVLESGKGHPFQTGIYRDDLIDSLRPIPERVHEYGGKVALQISHSGGNTSPDWRPLPILGPSPVINRFGHRVTEMNLQDIEEVVEAFGKAARRVVEAGFDALQIHSAHGYLIHQFLSPRWNRREDHYGGSIENRTRFLFDVTRRIRKEIGHDFPLLVKISCEDFLEGGLTLSETLWFCKRLSEMGVNAIEVSGGSREAGDRFMPSRLGIRRMEDEAYFLDQTRAIKRGVPLPVMAVGGIRSFEVAERILMDGDADYVSLCRPLIREPNLIERWRSGDRSRARCLSDNQCLNAAMQGKALHCVVEEKGRNRPDRGDQAPDDHHGSTKE